MEYVGAERSTRGLLMRMAVASYVTGLRVFATTQVRLEVYPGPGKYLVSTSPSSILPSTHGLALDEEWARPVEFVAASCD
jgi:hypothetical protein